MNLSRYASSFLNFAEDLFIPLGGGVGRFGDRMADFQRKDFEAMAPSLHALAAGEPPPTRRFWLERTKGASKDTDAAVALLWLLSFSNRPLRCQVGAFDSAQADEIRLIIRQILNIDAPLNALLFSVIDVQNTRIVAHADGKRGPGTSRPESVAEILTTDSRGTHGSRPDLVIANELSHISNQEFAETLLDNADKVPHGLVLVATNAGCSNLWQHDWREIAIESSDNWYFSTRSTPAPWISSGDLAESRLRNPPARYNRLWKGIWASGSGDALDPEDVEAAITLEGPAFTPDANLGYVAALDLGLKHDHSALVVIGVDCRTHRYRLADCQSWSPLVPGGKVRLDSVKDAVQAAHSRFGLSICVYDPWQCQLMAEQLAAAGVPMAEVPFVAKKLDRMAMTLLQVFRNRQIDVYRDKALLRDLDKLTIVERQKGFKLEATRDEHGHADRATALAMALPCAEDCLRWMQTSSSREPAYERIII